MLGVPKQVVVEKLNEVVRGWANYFYYGHCSKDMVMVKGYLDERARIYLRRKHAMKSRGYRAFPYRYLYKNLGLYKIYVSTLFTYHWNATVETIKHYKKLVKGDTSRIFVGGIMATLMADELWRETGVVPFTGLLTAPGALGDDNKLVVEDMIPDYGLFSKSQFNKNSLLFDKSMLFDKPIQQKPVNYTLVDDSYFGYSTRGCVRKCEFCGVRISSVKGWINRGLRSSLDRGLPPESFPDQYPFAWSR